MANSDQAQYSLRYNEISGDLEFGSGNNWTAITLANAGGITQLTGQVTAGPGSGSQSATVTNAAVIGKVLTGYVSGAGTVAATDTILQGINKLNGNDALKLPLSGGTITGTVTYSVPFVVNGSTLSGTGTITPDATANSGIYEVTVTGALTINGPTGGFDSQKLIFRILNDASHSVTLTGGAGGFRFGTDIPSYTNSVSKTDYVGAIWNGNSGTWDVVSVVQGF